MFLLLAGRLGDMIDFKHTLSANNNKVNPVHVFLKEQTFS